ncbi:MAG: hypothetical protein ABL966_16060, partial [Acidimicrobiales bacterium]
MPAHLRPRERTPRPAAAGALALALGVGALVAGQADDAAPTTRLVRPATETSPAPSVLGRVVEP